MPSSSMAVQVRFAMLVSWLGGGSSWGGGRLLLKRPHCVAILLRLGKCPCLDPLPPPRGGALRNEVEMGFLVCFFTDLLHNPKNCQKWAF